MHCQFTTVMTVVGIEIVREGEGGGCCRATVPAVLQYPRVKKGFPSNLLLD